MEIVRLDWNNGRLLAAYAFKLPRALFAVRNFHVLPLDRLHLLGPGQTDVRLRNGLTFRCRNHTADILTVFDVALMLEYPRRALLRIPAGGHVLDLGGHIGTFSIALKRLRPDLSITVVEPSLENFQLLKSNLARNRLEDQVTALLCAVGAFDGQAELSSDGTTDGWHLEGGGVSRAQPETVPVCRLETLLARLSLPRADLIKIDIEGAEYDLLEDAAEIIAACQGVLIEVHRSINGRLRCADGEQRVAGFFVGRGFRLEKVGLGNVFYAERRTRQ